MLHYDRINSQLRMIWDELRCHSYGTAIARALKPGDVVIDFGSGLGIWAMVAARSGASRVYAIEANDDVADVSRALIAENGFNDRITLINADAGTVDLPEKADLIVSELLNCAGFNEYDGQPLMKVRDRYLKPGGRMIPQRIRHLIRPCDLQIEFKSDDGQWADDMYGFTWNAVKNFASASPTNTAMRNYAWAAPAHTWWDLDLVHDDLSDNLYRHGIPVQWEMQAPQRVHGVVAYFEADIDDGIMLSTSPDAPPTHWGNTFLSFPRALQVLQGDLLDVKMAFSTGRGVATYPMSVTWTRAGTVIDRFDTYPGSIVEAATPLHREAPSVASSSSS